VAPLVPKACRPGSDVRVWFGDLPERTLTRLWELRSRVFPQGLEALERCIAVALAFGWQPSRVHWGANVASEWSRKYLADDCCLKVDDDNARSLSRALFRALGAAKMSQSLAPDHNSETPCAHFLSSLAEPLLHTSLSEPLSGGSARAAVSKCLVMLMFHKGRIARTVVG
jgi:hypothetical protein